MYLPVILHAACALAFLAYPGHVLMYAPGFTASPPSCNSNYLGYWLQNDNFASYTHSQRNYPCFSLSANDSAFCASESWGKITSGCNSCKCFPCIAAILTGLANTVRPFINKVSVTRCCSSSATATTTRGLKRPPERPTPTRPCWLSLSKARLKRKSANRPAPAAHTSDNGDGNQSGNHNVLLLVCLMAA